MKIIHYRQSKPIKTMCNMCEYPFDRCKVSFI